MSVRVGFWLALFAVGAASGGWLMWGQVQDARASAQAANDRAKELGKSLEALRASQVAVDALLADRKRQESVLASQLGRLRSDLDRVLSDDPKSSSWAAECVPVAVAQRLRLPVDPRCN